MELIPIIYTVLIIVAVIASTAIGVSYISFKIKEKKGLTDNPVRNNASSAQNFEQHFVKTVQRITKPIFHHETKTEKERYYAENSVKPQSEKTKEKNSITNSEKSSSRIEVVKSIGGNKIRPVEKEEKQDQQKKLNKPDYKTLNEEILDKYTDEHNDDMFTLKVSKKDNKKEP